MLLVDRLFATVAREQNRWKAADDARPEAGAAPQNNVPKRRGRLSMVISRRFRHLRDFGSKEAGLAKDKEHGNRASGTCRLHPVAVSSAIRGGAERGLLQGTHRQHTTTRPAPAG